MAFGLLMGKAAQHKNPKNLMAGLKKLSRHFDYSYIKHWPMFPLAYILTIAMVYTAGEAMAARSQRELKELLLTRAILDTTFFGGDLFWMWLAGRFVFHKSPIQPSVFVKKTRQRAETYAEQMGWQGTQAETFVQKISKQSSRMFLFSFLANILTVSAGIVLANTMTRKNVRHDAAQLTQIPLQPILTPLPISPYQLPFNQVAVKY